MKVVTACLAVVALIVAALAMPSLVAAEGTTGLVLLTQNKQAIDALFVNGEMRQDVISGLNAQARNVPPEIMGFFGDKKMNAYIQFDDGTIESFWVWTQGGAIKEISRGARGDASVEVRVRESTVDRIANSKTPFDEFIKAFNTGGIEYNGLTDSGKTESMVVRFVAAAAGIVSGIIGFITRLFGH